MPQFVRIWEHLQFGNFAASVTVARPLVPVVEVMVPRSLSKRYFVPHKRSEWSIEKKTWLREQRNKLRLTFIPIFHNSKRKKRKQRLHWWKAQHSYVGRVLGKFAMRPERKMSELFCRVQFIWLDYITFFLLRLFVQDQWLFHLALSLQLLDTISILQLWQCTLQNTNVH